MKNTSSFAHLQAFFLLGSMMAECVSGVIWIYDTVQSHCFKYSNSVLTPNFTASVSLAIRSVDSTLTSTTSGLC